MKDHYFHRYSQSSFSTEEVSIGEFCFLVFAAILSLLKALGFYEGQTVFNIGLVLAFCFLLVKIISTPMAWTDWVVTVGLLAIGLLVYHNTGEKSLLVNFAFLAGMKPVGGEKPAAAFRKRIVRTGLLCWGAGYVILTFLSLVGLHSDQLYMHNKRGIGFVLCHSLGYAHSNVLHINYLCISAMILLLTKDIRSKKTKLALTGILFFLDLYVFLYSMSYTGFLASILFYALYLYGTFRGELSKAEKTLAELILPACLLFSLVGPLVIRGTVYNHINDALNTRYDLTKWFFQNVGLTPFGTRVTIPNYRYTLDCSYAYLLIRLGVVPFAILILLYLGTIHRLVKEQRLTELAIMLGLCIGGVTEPFLFNLSFKNVTLVFVGEYLFDLSRRVSVSIAARRNPDGGVRQFCIWRKGSSRTISPKLLIADRMAGVAGRIAKEIAGRGLFYLLLFCLVLAAGSVAYRQLTTPAQMVFISGDVNEDKTREPMALSAEDVDTLKGEGAIILGYSGPDEEMYPYTGTTAAIEYDRRLVSAGLWTSCIVVTGMAMVRCFLRRRESSER